MDGRHVDDVVCEELQVGQMTEPPLRKREATVSPGRRGRWLFTCETEKYPLRWGRGTEGRRWRTRLDQMERLDDRLIVFLTDHHTHTHTRWYSYLCKDSPTSTRQAAPRLPEGDDVGRRGGMGRFGPGADGQVWITGAPAAHLRNWDRLLVSSRIL